MIKTYLRGDGNTYRRKKTHSLLYRIDTRSRALAIQIQEILARCGVPAYIKVSKRPTTWIDGRKVCGNTNYTVSFQLKRKRKFVLCRGDSFLVPIRKIERENYGGKVYNFQVAYKPNSYLVKGFAVHNCAANIAAGSVTTELVKGKTVDEAEKLTIKEITDALGGLPALKMHCAVLAYKTLKKALQEYRARRSGESGG
mgnify:CR=1 FL=1